MRFAATKTAGVLRNRGSSHRLQDDIALLQQHGAHRVRLARRHRANVQLDASILVQMPTHPPVVFGQTCEERSEARSEAPSTDATKTSADVFAWGTFWGLALANVSKTVLGGVSRATNQGVATQSQCVYGRRRCRPVIATARWMSAFGPADHGSVVRLRVGGCRPNPDDQRPVSARSLTPIPHPLGARIKRQHGPPASPQRASPERSPAPSRPRVPSALI